MGRTDRDEQLGKPTERRPHWSSLDNESNLGAGSNDHNKHRNPYSKGENMAGVRTGLIGNEMKPSERQPNRRLHECDECHARRMVFWVELNRAGKPRCTACGSTRLELVSAEAKDDRARLQDERSKGTHGSLKLSGNLEGK